MTEFTFPGLNFTFWDVAYVVLVYLFFLLVFVFLYFFYYHVIRSFQWPGEAKIQWTFRIYYGLALEFGAKPIFQLLTPYINQGKEIVGFLIGGQRYFFLLDPTDAHILLKDNPTPKTSNPIKENLLMNLFNINPSFWVKGYPNKQKLQEIHENHLISNDSLQKHLSKIIKKSKELYIQELVLPVQSSTSNLFAVSLYEFIARCIFHINLTTLFQPSQPQATKFPTTSEDGITLYANYRNFINALPLTAGGIHLQYFPQSDKAYKELLTTFSTFNQGISEIQQNRLHYFYDICNQQLSSDFRSEIHKYQLSFLLSAVENTTCLAFWVIFCILYHQHHQPNQKIIETLRQEIRENIPNYHLLYESNLMKEGTAEEAEEATTTEDFTVDQLSRLTHLDACITETLRLTSGSLILKRLEEKASVKFSSGKVYSFRKHDRIGISPSVFHYDENYFDDPHDFHPERWLKGETIDEKHAAARGNLTIKTKEGKMINR